MTKIQQKQQKKISNVYGKGVITDYQVQKHFSKFCSGDISLRDEPRPRPSSYLNQDALRGLLGSSPCKSNLRINT